MALFLALLMCLSLCACGVTSAESSNGVAQTPQVIYPDTTGEKIKFDDLVLAEDNNVKVMLTNFYEEEMYLVNGTQNEKCATLKIENKTDQELSFYVRAYLNNEELSVIGMSGNSVEAGRIGNYSATYDYGVYPNTTVVESLDKL